MTDENRIDAIARRAYGAGLEIVEDGQGRQPTPPRRQNTATSPQDNETLAILEKWKGTANSEATAPKPLSPQEAAAIQTKEQAQVAIVTSGPVDTNGTVPTGRNAPQRQPGLRFVAIVIDGQVVEGMTATERLVAALTSGPEVVDVTENAWLPEIGDYYQDGVFLFNPSGGMNR